MTATTVPVQRLHVRSGFAGLMVGTIAGLTLGVGAATFVLRTQADQATPAAASAAQTQQMLHQHAIRENAGSAAAPVVVVDAGRLLQEHLRRENGASAPVVAPIDTRALLSEHLAREND